MSSAFERLQKLAQAKKEQDKPKLEIVGKDTTPTQRTQPNVPNQVNQPNVPNQPKPHKPVAPEKDFTKVPNSVTRDAIPERLFKGMSKNTYDALYLKTRGAINPVRKIRATKSDLIRWTGVSDVTLDKHLKHLKSVGLVNWQLIIGSHDGNWYEVFIPEEIDLTNLTNLTNPNPANQPNKVGGQVPNLVGDVGGVQLYENKGVLENPKTSFKTNTIDDETFAKMITKLTAATVKFTGKKPTKNESEKWEALADLLILELEVAAARAGGVSSVPAFLTEVLRRQFFATRSKMQGLRSKVEPDTVGKNDSEPWKPEPLDEEGREEALKMLREMSAMMLEKYGDGSVDNHSGVYTPEDWEWLNEKLKAS